MSVLEGAVELPALAFATAWAMLDLGNPHPVLGTHLHHWASDSARRELHAQTLAVLAEHGLARHGRLNPLWRTTLRVLSTPDREFYAWSGLGDGTRRAALVALRGEDAVRLLVKDHTVELRPLPTKWPATSLYDTLPDLPGARIRTVTVPHPADDAPSDPFTDHRDEDHLTDVLRLPQDAVHQLYTARRTHGGRSRSLPITALDLTDHGRALTYQTADGHLTLTAGTPSAIVATLNETHAAL